MHVIANSDSAADQATKLAVRDAILDYERGMGNVGSAEEVKARPLLKYTFALSDGIMRIWI